MTYMHCDMSSYKHQTNKAKMHTKK